MSDFPGYGDAITWAGKMPSAELEAMEQALSEHAMKRAKIEITDNDIARYFAESEIDISDENLKILVECTKKNRINTLDAIRIIKEFCHGFLINKAIEIEDDLILDKSRNI